MPVEQAIGGDRGERRADGLDRRRRAAGPPGDPRDRGRSWSSARSSSTSARTRCCWRRSSTTSSRARTSRGRSTSTACASATTRRSSREGVFDKAVAAIQAAKAAGFRVTTNTTFFTHDSPKTVREVLDFLNDDLEVDEMRSRPAYAYEKAPDQEHFLGVAQTRRLFSEAFADGRRKEWRLNHSPLFLDFLEGKAEFECTAWGIPSYSLFGWQRPCYLMADGYVADLQGADRDDRLEQVRARPRPALRQLHGPLRLRADRGARRPPRRCARACAPPATPSAARSPTSAGGDGSTPRLTRPPAPGRRNRSGRSRDFARQGSSAASADGARRRSGGLRRRQRNAAEQEARTAQPSDAGPPEDDAPRRRVGEADDE